MLCKKCRTSVSESDRTCNYCGAKQINVKMVMYLLTGILLVLLSGSVVYVFMDIKANHSNKIVESEQLDIDNESQSNVGYEIVPAPTPNTQLPVEDVSHPTEDSQVYEEIELAKILKASAVNASKYYIAYSYYIQFVTKHGYLYDESLASYVSSQDFVRAGLSKEAYEDELIYILYVKPSDIGIESASNSLEVYAAYDATENFMIADELGNITYVSREDFAALIDSYNCEHGQIVRPNEKDYQHKLIVDAIRSYEFSAEGYDVRFLAYDNKYAVAAVSLKSTPNVISEYVMEKYSGQWVVKIASFETFDRFRIKINELLPDINMDLLPKFDLQRFAHKFINDFSHINTMMEASGYFAEDDAIIFQTGTNEFVYQEYSSGRRIVFARSVGEGWLVLEVKNWQEAEAQMAELSDSPPLFLIRQR